MVPEYCPVYHGDMNGFLFRCIQLDETVRDRCDPVRDSRTRESNPYCRDRQESAYRQYHQKQLPTSFARSQADSGRIQDRRCTGKCATQRILHHRRCDIDHACGYRVRLMSASRSSGNNHQDDARLRREQVCILPWSYFLHLRRSDTANHRYQVPCFTI